MKRIVLAIVILGVVAAAGAVWYVYRPLAQAALPEEMLPGETLMVVEAMNLKETIAAFQKSPLGQALAGIDAEAALRQTQARPEDIAQFLQVRDQFRDGLASPWFDTLFGQRVTLAILPGPLPKDAASGPQVAMKWGLMILKPSQPAEMISYIGKMFSGDVTVTPMETDGVKLDRLEAPNGPPVFAAISRGLGFVALDPEPIVRCLSQKGSAGAKLAQAPQYKAFQAELTKPGATRFFAYLNLHDVINQITDAAGRLNPGDETLNQMKGLWEEFNRARPMAAMSLDDDGAGMTHGRGVLKYNAKDLGPEIAGLLTIQPQKNETLAMMPAEPIYYGWQNNLKHMLKGSLNSSSLKDEHRAAIKDQFMRVTGVSIDEAIDAVGDQFVILFQDVRIEGMFPVPELALMMEVRKPEVIERMVDAAINGPQGAPMPMETEDYNGIPIRYAVLPYGDDISPAYACAKGFCVIASNRRILKSIFTPDAGANLAASKGFKAVDKGLSDANNQVAYLNSKRAIERTEGLLKWGLSFAAMSGKVKDENTLQYFSEKVAAPLFKGLAMYQNMGFRSVIQENGVQSDFYVQKAVN